MIVLRANLLFLRMFVKGMGDDEEEPEDTKAVEDAEAVGHARVDGLRQDLKRRQREASQ